MAAAYRQLAREHGGLHAASLQAPQVEDGELWRAGEAVVEVVLARRVASRGGMPRRR